MLTGDDRGVRAEVLSVDRKERKVIVQGVNLVYKHVRRSQRNPQGGRLSKEMPIPLSNVKLSVSEVFPRRSALVCGLIARERSSGFARSAVPRSDRFHRRTTVGQPWRVAPR